MNPEFEPTKNSHAQNLHEQAKPKQTWETPTLRVARTDITLSGSTTFLSEAGSYVALDS